jgi:transposase
MIKYTGIDVSKETFNVCFLQGQQNIQNEVFTNDLKGFVKLEKRLDRNDRIVMEATGPYYLRLACYLYDHGYALSVVNPLVIKRFCQMRLSRAKTDKKDAYLIACYAEAEKPALWVPDSMHIMQMSQTLTLLEAYKKQQTMLNNQLEALNTLPHQAPEVIKSLKKTLKYLANECERLEKYLEALVKEHYQQTFDALLTIPSIGKKSAILLIVITNNFENFDTSRQLLSYVGLAPRIYQSGTSVNGRAKICKMGAGRARSTLYMCAWTAKFCNKSCKELYQRLKEKGKPEKVIKIAIANKLLRIAFAVGKSLTPYDKNYAA